MNSTLKKLFPTIIDRSKARDTGLAMVLICMILGLWLGESVYFKLAIVLLVLTMIAPGIFKLLGYVWFGLAHVLGTIMSKVILFIVYVVIVSPVGMVRKASGKDPMKLKEWKKSGKSAFTIREHLYTAEDIEKPY